MSAAASRHDDTLTLDVILTQDALAEKRAWASVFAPPQMQIHRGRESARWIAFSRAFEPGELFPLPVAAMP